MYALTKIETLISNTLHHTQSGSSKVKLVEFDRLIEDEVCKVKACFREMLLSDNDESHLRRFYYVHQVGLVSEIKRLEEIVTGGSIKIQPALLRLTDLLEYMRSDFSVYFNHSLIAPSGLVQAVQVEILSKQEFLSSRPLKECIDKVLWNISSVPITSFAASLATEYSFQQIDYLQLLQSSLIQFTPTVQDINVARQDLVNLLIKINFNTSDFFRFYCMHISSKLAVTETLSDRVDQVSYFIKTVSQVEVLPHVALNVDERHIKIQLLDWLASELEYLRQKQILQFPCPPQGDGIQKDFKLNFDLSVSQLAYLFKVFTETSVVQNKNTSELIRFLAKFVKTKRAETVSFESLRIKFYDVESGTKDAVKKMFQTMLSYMSKN